MSQWVEDLQALQTAFESQLEQVETREALEALRVSVLGKKGALTALLRQMGSLSEQERPLVGARCNEVRRLVETQLKTRQVELAQRALEAEMKREAIDITLPSSLRSQGTLHPLTKIIEEIENIFIGMGYSIAEGPEVEWARYNFDALRIPQGHVARGERDTFYIEDEILLRTQTSPVQIRVMENQQPPIKVIAPGKVYRPDTPDATHSPIFHQIEGLVVDRGVAMSDLVGTLKLFAQQLFGEQTQIRLRPHHFPFTEPSCEVDVTCWSCGGKGCRTCKGEGFVEVLGAGMVHPWVLEQAGIDPTLYSGFAFGIGVERTAMARFNVEDIRYFYENNLQFLQQFK